MNELPSGLLLKSLLEKYYGVEPQGELVGLPGEGGQRVFKVSLSDGETWTVRLGLASRPKEKLLAETGVLNFVNRAGFPAPHLKPTRQGGPIFEWQPGCWGYALEFVEGKPPPRPGPLAAGQPGPMLDRATLVELGALLGKLHNLNPAAGRSETGPLAASDWLEETPTAIEWAGQAAKNPAWARMAGEVRATLEALPLAELKALPRVLIHSDAHEGNLIRTPAGKLVLLDWENAGIDIAVIDLALVLSWLCSWEAAPGQTGPLVEKYDFNEEYCRAFLASYQQERALTGPERAMLGPAIRFLDGWFAARDINREIAAPGNREEMARLNWAFMRSVTPEWAAALARWAGETTPPGAKLTGEIPAKPA